MQSYELTPCPPSLGTMVGALGNPLFWTDGGVGNTVIGPGSYGGGLPVGVPFTAVNGPLGWEFRLRRPNLWKTIWYETTKT